MMRMTGRIRAAPDPRAGFARAALALLGMMMAATAALGQTGVPPEKIAPKQRVASPAVIHPAPHIDPAMRVPPPPGRHYPTPVVKPQPTQGNTVVVPKLVGCSAAHQPAASQQLVVPVHAQLIKSPNVYSPFCPGA